MKVVLLGRYADLAGWRERDLSPGPATLTSLIQTLSDQEPSLASELGARWTFVAVNHTQIRGDAPLSPGDEIAFMPPMSGG